MANQPLPNDPVNDPFGTRVDDPYRTTRRDDDLNRAAHMDASLQTDPALADRPSSGGRVAAIALGLAVVLGIAFYGFSHSNMQQSSTAPASQTASQSGAPAARDVTPRANGDSGMTTGSATNRPTPPQSSPTGTEVDRNAPATGPNNGTR
jgi:hypothetical protein